MQLLTSWSHQLKLKKVNQLSEFTLKFLPFGSVTHICSQNYLADIHSFAQRSVLFIIQTETICDTTAWHHGVPAPWSPISLVSWVVKLTGGVNSFLQLLVIAHLLFWLSLWLAFLKAVKSGHALYLYHDSAAGHCFWDVMEMWVLGKIVESVTDHNIDTCRKLKFFLSVTPRLSVGIIITVSCGWQKL